MTLLVDRLSRILPIVLVLTAGFPATSAAGAVDRPNIVVVMTDDQGIGDIGLHANPDIRTPTLDAFGRNGLQFSRFYCSPVCAL